MVSKDIDEFLDLCVKKSMEPYMEGLHQDYHMVNVAQNTSLHPDFDPFEMLAFELMARSARNNFDVPNEE